MNQQIKLSEQELFGINFGFCGDVCKLNKSCCAECLFNYFSNKYKIGILLDSDLIFKDELMISGLLDSNLFKYNFWLWLKKIELIFLGVYNWLVENLDVAVNHYYNMMMLDDDSINEIDLILLI